MKVLRALYPFGLYQLCNVTLVVATPAHSISISSDNATTDVYQAFNITPAGLSDLEAMPPEPYYQVVGDSLSIKLYDFFLQIPKDSMDAIYSGAERDIIIRLHSRQPMRTALLYTSNLTAGGGELALDCFPGDQMTWQMWAQVLHGMKNFMMTFEYVELNFDVLFSPAGRIGHGSVELTMDPG